MSLNPNSCEFSEDTLANSLHRALPSPAPHSGPCSSQSRSKLEQRALPEVEGLDLGQVSARHRIKDLTYP